MKYVEVIADSDSSETIMSIASSAKASDVRIGVRGDDGMRQIRMLVNDDKLQPVLDKLQHILGAQPTARIVVLAVETSLPIPEEETRKHEDSAVAARESLYEMVERNTQLDLDYLILVALSTLVSAIGLIEDSVAVIIGAMVIAPLLGPNLALSLGTALGDLSLVRKSAKALTVGILLSVLIASAIGFLWNFGEVGDELTKRTTAGLDTAVLALASGAAAALSLTTGLSSVLVGVMVAVALLPPATTLGIMLGKGNLDLAIGAGLVVAVNVVCVNLASKTVFYFKGIYPRTWVEKERAKRAMTIYTIGWIVTLLILFAIIFARRSLESSIQFGL